MAEYSEVVSALPYFGNIQFYAHLVQADLLIDGHEHYVKQSFRNRADLMGSQGRFSISVPVHRPSGQKIKSQDIKVSYAEPWQNNHAKAIRSAYGSSPFFIHYWDEIEALFSTQYQTLYDLNSAVHQCIASMLGIETQLRYSGEYVLSTPGTDLRPAFKKSAFNPEDYIQVFSDRFAFAANCSVLDLIFCIGPESLSYLQRQRLGP